MCHTIIAPFLVLPYLHARDLYSDLNILKTIREEMEQNIPNWCFQYAAFLPFSNTWHYPYLWIFVLSTCAYSVSCFDCSTKSLDQLSCAEVYLISNVIATIFFSIF